MGRRMSARPYDRLLKIVGKQAVIVELAEAPQSTVSYWAEVGRIPFDYIPTIIRNGQAKGLTIPREIFLPAEDAA